MPESAAHIQRNAYTPYGSQRALNTDLSDDSPDVTFDASLSIERSWLSQVADEATSSLGTGLTYLNARYYDPVTSRFLSPDPKLDVMDPKTLDPYRYAGNNPVFYSDTTGLWECPSGAGYDACIAMQNKLGMAGHTTWRRGGGAAAGSSGPPNNYAVHASLEIAGEAPKIFNEAYLADASKQGRLLQSGASNSLWKYSSNGSNTNNYFWTKGAGKVFARGGGALSVAGGGLDWRAKYTGRYANVEDDSERLKISGAHATAVTAAGVASGVTVAAVGAAFCATGIGCVIGIGILAIGAAIIASDQTDKAFDRLTDDYVEEANARAVRPQPWWVGRPGFGDANGNPATGIPAFLVPGINAPGQLQFPELLSSPSIEPYRTDGGTVAFICAAG